MIRVPDVYVARAPWPAQPGLAPWSRLKNRWGAGSQQCFANSASGSSATFQGQMSLSIV
jgi:hypothetical protein